MDRIKILGGYFTCNERVELPQSSLCQLTICIRAYRPEPFLYKPVVLIQFETGDGVDNPLLLVLRKIRIRIEHERCEIETKPSIPKDVWVQDVLMFSLAMIEPCTAKTKV